MFESVSDTFLTVSVVTRSQARKVNVENEETLDNTDQTYDLTDFFQSFTPTNDNVNKAGARVVAKRRALSAAQQTDENSDCAAEEAEAGIEGSRSNSSLRIILPLVNISSVQQ